MKRIICLLIISIQSLGLLVSQEFPNWVNCLSGDHINDIFETDTNLWLATTGGLVVHNKQTAEITYYNRGNSLIPSNDIQSIVVDKDNLIWVATSSGLSSFDGLVWNTFDQLHGVLTLNTEDNTVLATGQNINIWNGESFDVIDAPIELQIGDVIINQENGDIWLNYWTFGMYKVLRYANNEWTVYDHQNSVLPFESPHKNPFSFDDENILWLVNSSGLFKFDNEEWVDMSHLLPNTLDGYLVDLIHDDNGNTFLIAFNYLNELGSQLIQIDQNENVTSERIPLAAIKKQYPTIIKTSADDDGLFIGFSNIGCWKYQATEWSKVKTSNTNLTSNQVNISKTSNDDIWIHKGSGYYYYPETIINYNDGSWNDVSTNYPFDYSTNRNFRISKGLNNDKWLHTNDTLYTQNNGNWEIAAVPDLLPDVNEQNSTIFFDNQGRKWLMEAYQSYIFFESEEGWLSFPHQEHRAACGQYFSIFNHPLTNDLWFSSYNGISIYDYDNNSWELIDLRDFNLPDEHATFSIDSQGSIWGICRNTFFKFIDDTVEVIATTDAIYSQDVRFSSIFCDEDDVIWLGMAGAVATYNNAEFTVYDNNHSGIANGAVNSILKDQNNNIWFGNRSGGISIFNPNGLSPDLLEEIHTSLEIEDHLNDVVIFPNPSNGVLIIKLENNTDFHNIKIVNVTGQLIKSYANIIGEKNINISEMAKGIYFITTENIRSKNITTKKLIIE